MAGPCISRRVNPSVFSPAKNFSCAPGAATCGPAGWDSYQTQLERAIARVADGVVVGSALVALVKEHGTAAAEPIRAFTASLAQAVHTAREVA